MSTKTKAFIRRLLKGFFFGAVSSMLVTLGTLPTMPSWHELGVVAPSLVIGFLTGGLMAAQKMMSWKEGIDMEHM